MLLAHFSDTHMLVPGAEHEAAMLRADWLRQTVDDLNSQNPDAVIFTGDTTQTGQREEYETLFGILQKLDAPLYVIPGNRDDKSELRRALDGQDYVVQSDKYFHYVVDIQDVRLVGVDSTDQGERKGVFCAERQAWLNGILGDTAERPTLLFVHHPPFDVDDHYVGGYRRAEEATALTKLISENDQVIGLLCGHVHCPVNREWNGVRAVVTPSVAVDLRKGIDENEAEKRPIYTLHRYSNDAGLTSFTRTVGANA